MPHNDRSRPASQWVSYAVPNARDMALWDRMQYQAVSGDLGGYWNPATPIVIGGLGLEIGVDGPSIIGGVNTQSGGRLVLGNVSGGDEVVIFGGSTVSRRTIVMPIAGLAQQALVNDGTLAGLNTLTTYNSGTLFGALSAPAGTSVPPPIIVPIPSRYLHHGASIKSGPSGLSASTDAYFGWRLSGRLVTPPLALPATILSANIFWVNAATGALVGSFAPQHQVAGGDPLVPVQWAASTSYTAGTSYVFPAPGSGTVQQTGLYYKCTTSGTSHTGTGPAWPTTIGATVTEVGGPTWTAWGYGSLPAPSAQTLAAYYQSGAPQTIRISPMTDVEIDTTQNAYFLQIQPDTCRVGWLWTGMELAFTNIGTFAFE